MATAIRQKKPLGRTLLLGIATAGLYAAAFSQEGPMMSLFTKGGIYSALPIATVFVFSFVHGAFASNLWTCLGITARKTAARRPVATEAVRTGTRPRATAQQQA